MAQASLLCPQYSGESDGTLEGAGRSPYEEMCGRQGTVLLTVTQGTRRLCSHLSFDLPARCLYITEALQHLVGVWPCLHDRGQGAAIGSALPQPCDPLSGPSGTVTHSLVLSYPSMEREKEMHGGEKREREGKKNELGDKEEGERGAKILLTLNGPSPTLLLLQPHSAWDPTPQARCPSPNAHKRPSTTYLPISPSVWDLCHVGNDCDGECGVSERHKRRPEPPAIAAPALGVRTAVGMAVNP
ncbi:hypothetical protein JZ751_004205 [Albula glossodonta]|uniref:Uncharacterized protein n=1 Tax=Albula glossodonta TaxID=121402 RepID=A0A8T2N5Y9_9TELE|nr:hypothetical protein JZ751_004205 [Albula glossodonta]